MRTALRACRRRLYQEERWSEPGVAKRPHKALEVMQVSRPMASAWITPTTVNRGGETRMTPIIERMPEREAGEV